MQIPVAVTQKNICKNEKHVRHDGVHKGWFVSGQHLGPLSGSLFGPDRAPLLSVECPNERADRGPAHDVDGNPRLLHGLDDTHVGAAST